MGPSAPPASTHRGIPDRESDKWESIEQESPKRVSESPEDSQAGAERKMRAELDRRITEFACYPDGTFGPLDVRDLVVTLLLCIAAPLALVWLGGGATR
jgi:hypothetical protein